MMGYRHFRHGRYVDADAIDILHNDMTRLQRWDKGTANIIKDYGGGGTTGDDREIYANIIDAYPKIRLYGGAHVDINVASGNDLRVREETTNRFVVSGGMDNCGINGYPPDAHGDLFLMGAGAVALKETTTPTATADYAKLYTKNDNHLYWQSGAGVEYDLGGA